MVVTLNMDTNPGVIAPYLGKEGFTFPVLPAYDDLSEDADDSSIPQSWVLAPDGTVRYEQRGYDAGMDEEQWLSDVEDRMEDAAGG